MNAPIPNAPGVQLGRAGGPGARENKYGVVLGMKRYGKTTYARGVVQKAQAVGKSLVFVDPTRRNADFGRVVHSGKAFWSVARAALAQRQPFAVVIQLGWNEKYSDFWELIYKIGNTVLVLDEIHLIASAQRIESDFENLVRMGGNQCIDIITTTQTPPGVHGVVKGNADWVVSFRQSTLHYAEVVAEQFFHMRRAEHDRTVRMLLSLPKFHYLRFAADAGLTRGVVRPTA